jgi:hypothetical protein
MLPVYSNLDSTPRAFRGITFIIDPNGTFDYPANEIFRRVEDVKIDKNDKVLLYRPGAGQRSGEQWNELFRRLYTHRGPLMTYVDETFALEPLFRTRVFPGGNYFTAYLTSGRARGKAAILGAQRPVNIPRNVIGQAEWFYVFDLPLEDDRATVAGTIGELSDTGERIRDRNTLRRFEFWFKGPDLRNPVKAQVVK